MKQILLLSALLLLSGCSSESEVAVSETGPCSKDQQLVLSDHISSQIDAIAKLDFKKAYTFAAKSFQDNVSVSQFERIILRQYQMLITNNGYSFTDCLAEPDYFVQSVVVDTDDGKIDLTYRLTLVDNRLGVVAVSVKPSSFDLAT
jgi:hypothetical protein